MELACKNIICLPHQSLINMLRFMLRSLIKYFDFAKIDIFTDTESIHLDQKKSKNNSFALILSFVYIKYERKKVFTHI